jgi:hypothetical protein
MKGMVAVFAVWFLGACPAWAVLGQYESSVSLDQEYMRGELREEARQGYKLQEITSPDGSIVREYVSPAGLVFGIAWQTRVMPNLQQLLGSYFTEFQQAAQSKVRRRGGPLLVRTGKLVLFSGGHMRSFHGSAYAPSLLPKNLSPEAVR